MGQIQRYKAVKFGNPDNWHATLSPSDNGSAVLYADHLAAMSAKDEQIRQLREALHQYKRNCVNNGAKLCDLCKAADALLEAK